MTVYVDNARIPATVGRIRGRWSHLTADTPAELHQFAARLGHQRNWFQGRCRALRCPQVQQGVCVHFHYDVTDSRRTAALAAGAVGIGIRDLGEIIKSRRSAISSA